MQQKFTVSISPLKEGAVCPECSIILGDATCIGNNHVCTLVWNCCVYTAVTTLLICILGRFHSLFFAPPWFFFHAAYCERSHQKVVEHLPQFLSFNHNSWSELCFTWSVGHQTRSTDDHWKLPADICIPLRTGTCGQLKLSRENWLNQCMKWQDSVVMQNRSS